MDNRFFSLIVIPDSGTEVKTGSFNFKLILGVLTGLVTIFLTCLFFIIGYHIKLNQEKNYKVAITVYRSLLSRIEESRQDYAKLSDRLLKIQNNDKAFRNFNRMEILDNEMYRAGIGGHAIVSNDYSDLGSDLAIDLETFDTEVTSLDHRAATLEKSFSEIQTAVSQNRDIYNNTPSILPTNSFRFTGYYRWRIHPVTKIRHFHAAVDLAGYRGQDIFSTADGVITTAKYQGALGRCVKIKHKYGYETLYGHMTTIKVKVGDKVKKGDVIGTMGSTGRTTGVHVHYAVILNGKSQNPLDYF